MSVSAKDEVLCRSLGDKAEPPIDGSTARVATNDTRSPRDDEVPQEQGIWVNIPLTGLRARKVEAGVVKPLRCQWYDKPVYAQGLESGV